MERQSLKVVRGLAHKGLVNPFKRRGSLECEMWLHGIGATRLTLDEDQVYASCAGTV